MHIADEGLEKCEPVLENTRAPGTCMGNQHMCWAPIATKPNVHTNHVSLNPVARQFILTLYYCPPLLFFKASCSLNCTPQAICNSLP